MQGGLVVVDVLEHVERADDVPLVVERHVDGIELQQLRLRDALARESQALRVELGAGQRQLGMAIVDAAQHVAGAAADLEQRTRVREVALQRPQDHRVASAEPERALLGDAQSLERARVEAAALIHGRGREMQDPVVQLGLEATGLAAPAGALQARVASDAPLHAAASATAAPMPVRPYPLPL
jgi:hypothetical protein